MFRISSSQSVVLLLFMLSSCFVIFLTTGEVALLFFRHENDPALKPSQPFRLISTKSNASEDSILPEELTFQQMSEQYRNTYDQVLELWFFLRHSVAMNQSKETKTSLYDRYMHLLAQMEKIRDVLEPVRKQKASKVSSVIYQRLHYLQNPEDCETAKFAICDLNKNCGFGCQLHHAAHCFISAYALQRTLLLNGTPWNYNRNGFHSVFQADRCNTVISSLPHVVDWRGDDDHSRHRVIRIAIVESMETLPNFMPLAIPGDLITIKSFHSQPFAFWVGHFLRYILRPMQSTCQNFLYDIRSRIGIDVANLAEIRPYVGIHVRRTDKLFGEAKMHELGEYMEVAEEYFMMLDYKLNKRVVRRVYLATDDPSIIKSAESQFPTYKFYCDSAIAESARVEARNSEKSLQGILVDLFFLSRSDFLVCTFSSQLSRLAFELMQTLHGDAGDRFRSLDDAYYYGGQQNHLFEAISDHKAASINEIDLQRGDLIQPQTRNNLNGFCSAINRRTEKHGLIPTYKIRDVIITAESMPLYTEIQYSNRFRLTNDTCLLK